MDIKKINSPEEFEKATEKGIALVDFNAPWCGPCRAQEPIIHDLSDKFAGKALIAEMNVDENQETAVKLGIQSIPTLTLYKDGKEVRRFVGVQSDEILTQAIDGTF